MILNGPAKKTLTFVHNISKCLNGVKLIIYGSIPFDFFFALFLLVGLRVGVIGKQMGT